MPITKITIKRANHETQTITSEFRLKLYRPNDLPAESDPNKLEVSGNTVTLTMPPITTSMGQEAVDRLVEMGKGWLRSINHIEAPEGQFLLTGDACFSWIPGDTDIHTYVRNTSSNVNGTTIQSYLAEKGGGIHILNMCAACGSCQTESTLRIMLENVKLRLNEMKDCNLYDSATATERRIVLRSNLMPPDAACGIPVRTWLADTVRSNMLLGQYATCVHMWNYVAARAHSSTTVELAQQDSAGLIIRTKRSFPACLAGNPAIGTGGTIKCEVDVKRVHVDSNANSSWITDDVSDTDTDISVYIPPPETGFGPFQNAAVGEHDATIDHDQYNAAHKTVTTSTWQVGTAGTYMLSLYVLPFYYAEFRTAATGAPWNNGNHQLEPQTSPGGQQIVDPDGIAYKATRYTHTAAYLVRRVKYLTADTNQTPTGADMYNMYTTYPSVSSQETFLWRVEVIWTLDGLEVRGIPDTEVGQPVAYTETFLIEAPRPRRPADSLLPVSNSQYPDGTIGPNDPELNGYKLFTNTTLYDVNPSGSR